MERTAERAPSSLDHIEAGGYEGPDPMTTLSAQVEYAERWAEMARKALPHAEVHAGPRILLITQDMQTRHVLLSGVDDGDLYRVRECVRALRGPSRWARLRRVLARAACW